MSDGFFKTVEEGQAALVKKALDEGDDPNCVNRFRQTPLAVAAERGYAEVVQVLIAAGAKVEAADGSGRTPLMRAAMKGRVRCVRVLLNAGADPLKTDTTGGKFTPLIHAAREGQPEVVQVLIDREPNVLERHSTALFFAASGGYPVTVRTLVQNCAKLYKDDPTGWAALTGQALIGAAENGWPDTVRVLLFAGADVNVRARCRFTALHLAVREWKLSPDQDHKAVIALLIEAGADVNARDENGFTPLMFAVERGDAETVRMLLKAAAAPGIRTEFGVTALALAEGVASTIVDADYIHQPNAGRPEIVRILSEAMDEPLPTTDEVAAPPSFYKTNPDQPPVDVPIDAQGEKTFDEFCVGDGIVPLSGATSRTKCLLLIGMPPLPEPISSGGKPPSAWWWQSERNWLRFVSSGEKPSAPPNRPFYLFDFEIVWIGEVDHAVFLIVQMWPFDADDEVFSQYVLKLAPDRTVSGLSRAELSLWLPILNGAVRRAPDIRVEEIVRWLGPPVV